MKCRNDEENLGITGFHHVFLCVAQNLKNRQSLTSTCSHWQYEGLMVCYVQCDWHGKSTCKSYWPTTSVILIRLNVRTDPVLKLRCS